MQEHWNRRFAETAADELTWFTERPEHSLRLIEAHSPGPTASVVDVGAGNGLLVDHLLRRHYRDVTLVDLSDEGLAQTRTRLGPTVGDLPAYVTADIREWQPGRSFDIWHDRALFHFMVEEGDRAAYLRALDLGTRPGSLVILSTFAPDGPESCSGLPVRRYDAAALSAVLGPRFDLIHAERTVHVTPRGAEQVFTVAAFRRVVRDLEQGGESGA